MAFVVAAAVVGLATRSSNDSSTSASTASSGQGAVHGTTAGGPVLQNKAGDVQLTLPTGWLGADVEDGPTGVGAQVFPTDAGKASQLEQRLQVLPRTIVLFGVNTTDPTSGFAENVNVSPDPTAPLSYTLADIGAAELDGTRRFGAVVVDRGTVDLGSQQAYRFTYTANGFAGIAYVIKGSESVWVAIYTFGSLSSDNEAVADGSAATLVIP